MVRQTFFRTVLALVVLLCGSGAFARPPQPATAHTDIYQSGEFDYYLLALSWSPNYCLTHPEDRAQCRGKGYGFVLHGLWPQFMSGGYPHDCATKETLTQEATDLGNTVFPSPKLLQHEWAKHGTCSGLSATDYVKAADTAVGRVNVPETLQAPDKTFSTTAAEIVAAFSRINPGIPPGGIVVTCGGPELSEVRVCLNRDLTLAPCGKGVKTSCRQGLVRVRSVR